MSEERLHDQDQGLEPWQLRLKYAGVPKAAWNLDRHTIVRTPANIGLLEALIRYDEEKGYNCGKGITVIGEYESDATLLLAAIMRGLIQKFRAMVMMETFHEAVCLDYSELSALAMQTDGDHFLFRNVAEARFLFLDHIDNFPLHPAITAALHQRVKHERVTFLRFLGSSLEELPATAAIHRMFSRLNETIVLD